MHIDDQLFQVIQKYDFDLYRDHSDVPSYLDEHFAKYIDDIERAAAGTNPLLGSDFCNQVLNNITTARAFCNELVDIGRIYRNGQIKESFEKAYNLFMSMSSYYVSSFFSARKYGAFYRIRQGDFRIQPDEDSKKKKAELFHIKNNNRNLIGAYRFSIPGYPCLYLTTGFELGWFESGMPQQFSYCRMLIENSGINALRLIDISNRPVDLISNLYAWISGAKDDHGELSKIYKYLMNYIITYPLAAACSIKVKDRGDRFIEEYVIPQMFMNWIREHDSYDGIIYKSSLNTSLVWGMGAVNVALPVKKFRADGLCEYLTSKIVVSDIAYMDVNTDFKKYKQSLLKIQDFKNDLLNKRIRGDYCGSYALRLIEICETINATYSSIISGGHLDEVVLHQIDCLADYVYTILENKEGIIKMNIAEVEKLHLAIDTSKLQQEISNDIENFYRLVTQVIHKHEVFHFSVEDTPNYEKI